MEPLSLGLLLDTTGGAISSRLGILWVSCLFLKHFAKQSRIAKTNIINDIIATIEIQTILLVAAEILLFLEFGCSVGDGASTCFPGFLSEGGAGDGVGGGEGTILLLKGFPSFLRDFFFFGI